MVIDQKTVHHPRPIVLPPPPPHITSASPISRRGVAYNI